MEVPDNPEIEIVEKKTLDPTKVIDLAGEIFAQVKVLDLVREKIDSYIKGFIEDCNN